MKRAAKRKKDALSGTSSSASAETFTETQLLDIAPAVSLPHPALPLFASGRSGKNGPTNPLHTVAIERVEARQPRSAPYTMYIYIYTYTNTSSRYSLALPPSPSPLPPHLPPQFNSPSVGVRVHPGLEIALFSCDVFSWPRNGCARG